MTFKKWFFSLLLLCIPVVDVVMFIIWFFGGGKQPVRTNFCRAALAVALLPAAICLIIALLGVDYMALISPYLPTT